MRVTRWTVGVASAAFAVMLLPEVAGAGVPHHRVATTFAGGGAQVLVVQVPRATPLAGSPIAPFRVRGAAAKDGEDKTPIDRSDPWTREEIPQARVAAPKRMQIDNVDPWSGQTIVVKASAFGELDTLDPYRAD